MSDRRYQRINEIFLEACELQGQARDDFLKSACDDASIEQEVRELLDCDAQDAATLDDAAEGHSPWSLETDPLDGGDPESIGPYRIVGRLGDGGMGVVYAAHQESLRRTVALKVIRGLASGEEVTRRFQREGEILARLHHPGIAQVFETNIEEITLPSGETHKRPYMVMEHVSGQPLDSFVFDRDLRIRDIASILADICDAIQHAHEKGVIHRDLKPANILVQESGRPKVLDFGVARVLDPSQTFETKAGHVLGTLAYMSPEQLAFSESDLDHRADVYSLGAILYQLLTRKLPHDVSSLPFAVAAELIRHHEAPRLSLLDPVLRGDLETIVMKCLEKERAQRYDSAALLAEDLRRFVQDHPILARPPSTFYHVKKFARRNRALVASLAMLFAILVTALIVVVDFWKESDRARQAEALEKGKASEARVRAEEEAAIAEAVNRYLIEILHLTNPEANYDSQGMKVSDLLDLATEKIEKSLEGQDVVESRVRLTIARAYVGQGQFTRARRHFERGLELHRTLGLPTLELEAELIEILLEVGATEDAENLTRKVLSLAEKDSEIDVRATISLARLKTAGVEHREARVLFEQALEVLESRGPEEANRRASLRADIAVTLWQDQRYEEAETSFREAVELFEQAHPDGHPDLASCMSNLAVVLRSRQKYEEAEALYAQVLAIQERIYGESHPARATTLNNLARLKEFQGETDEAERLFRESLAMRIAFHGEEHLDVAASRHNLGDFLRLNGGDPSEARALILRALEVRRKALGRHESVAESLISIADLHEKEQNLAEACEALEEVVSIREDLFGDGLFLGASRFELGRNLFLQGKGDRAIEVLRRSVANFDEDNPEHLVYLDASSSWLIEALIQSRQWEEAESLALESYERLEDDSTGRKRGARKRLERLYRQWGKPDEAARWR